MNLNEWAIKWQIPYEAIEDLRRQFGMINTDPARCDALPASEAANQNLVRLEGSRVGGRLWRNNVGVLQDDRGVPVRYGLANDSKQMNKLTKSSDLIGLKSVLVQPYHVGVTLGVFVAREIKPGDWKFTGREREVAQLNYLELVASLGGDACFATGEGTL